jgi:hypothetical protein
LKELEAEIQDAIDRLNFILRSCYIRMQIGANPVPLDEELIDQAVTSEGMRATRPISLIEKLAMCDNASAFWIVQKDLGHRFYQSVQKHWKKETRGRGYYLAIGPQPLLVYLGICLVM